MHGRTPETNMPRQLLQSWGLKYIKEIQIFVMNITNISSTEVKNIYFMSDEATIEIYNFFTSAKPRMQNIIFSLHEMNQKSYS